jgi:alpha-tubulin suppressor-like RCC1 family protein
MRRWRACVSILLLQFVAALSLTGCGSSGGGTGEFEQRPTAGLRKTPFEPSLSVTFASVELGYGHTCGLTADGRAYCMGDNEYGQLGTGAPMQRCKGGQFPCSPTPLPVDGALAFVQLGLDQRDSCGLTTDGSIYCWGFGVGGQLGDGLRSSSPVPVRTATDQRFRYLGHGQASNNLCAISAAGLLYCWGIGDNGQGGNGTVDAAPVPTPVASSSTFREVGSGQDFACALAESGDVYCWGRNAYGKLGTGVAAATTVPALVAGGLQYAALAVGGQHACALTTSGRAYCWGFAGSVGGTGPADGARTPQAVEGGLVFKRIASGFQHTCAIDAADDAWCWGMNGAGVLGDGTTTDRVAPVRVSTREKFAAIAGGGTATCGITQSGRILCWGLNSFGQLGFAPGDP